MEDSGTPSGGLAAGNAPDSKLGAALTANTDPFPAKTASEPQSLGSNASFPMSTAGSMDTMRRERDVDIGGSGPLPPLPGQAAGDASQVDENFALMDPDNPLMQRVQDALYKQLTAANDRLTLELREKEESLKKAKESREDIGVELYALQQQLFKSQEQLETLHQSYAVIKSHREKAEQRARESQDSFTKRSDHLTAQQRALESRKQELETLNRTLAQVQFYHDDMKSRLSTTRRVTLKAEEDLLKQEGEKRRQDFYIHQLEQRLERLKDQRATLDSQIQAQRAQIEGMRETVQDANTEMEAIVVEKRQLVHQWKSSLLGMQRRQDVLGSIDAAIHKEKEAIITMDNELVGFKHALQRIAGENETLTMLHDKLSTESQYLNTQITELSERRDNLKHQYGVVQHSLEACEGDLKKITHNRQSLINEVNGLKKQIHSCQQKSVKIEKEIAEQVQIQLGIDKGMGGTLKDARKLTQVIHEKEGTIAASENHVATIKLEGSQVSNTIQQLKEELGGLDSTIADKNATIEKYETEIRRGNDDMVKKQSEIDLLNKKLNQILSHSAEEALGPLEATIHNLAKSLSAKEKECWDLQQFWLRTQNELVATVKKSSELTDNISTLKMRLTILTRKKAMLNQEFDTEEAEIKFHQRNIKALQNEMLKINTLVFKQSSVQADLEEGNLGLEQEFRYRLKEAEMQAVRMEHQVRDLKTEKDRALVSLLDMERQVMLWEKKIQLAKETREALDPNIGAQEIKEMTMEIHRMELRLSNLQKVQEKLVTEMEKSVVRRETIAVRSKLRGKGYSQAALDKAISDLNKKLKATMNDTRDTDKSTAAISEALARIKRDVINAQNVLEAIKKRQAVLMGEVQVKMDEKTAIFSEISLYQKKGKRLQTAKDGKYTFLKSDPNERQAEIERTKDRVEKIEKILAMVMADCLNELGPAVHSLEAYLGAARRFVLG